jgi:catechol 2,3-dioxygenase-like lactoylglutathione lyase family enzyme
MPSDSAKPDPEQPQDHLYRLKSGRPSDSYRAPAYDPARVTRPVIGGISPFFIVAELDAALGFYRDKLGFDVTFRGPEGDPFFGIVQRDGAMIMFKAVGVAPLPNCLRQAGARWDAYVYVPDPDSLASEFASSGVSLSAPLKDTDDGLRGFELTDVDGYVLFFGRTRG